MLARGLPQRVSLRAIGPNARLPARALSSSARRSGYEDTISNLNIGQDTRVMYQGFTGRVSTSNAQQSLEYGTKIVGGTTPGKEGEHLGLPLLPTVEQAAKQLKPDASAVFVAAQHAGKAIEDAIAAEIPLIVAVAEFIPVHDVLRISAMLKSQSKSRLVGANSPGIIAPLGFCRIGFQPLPCYMPGHIGVVAKSGTLSYETVGALTRANLGQSLCIGMGGDIVAGTNMVEGLTHFENDPNTHAIILCGEIGGRAELDAAEWIKDYRRRVSNPKPIAALVGGLTAPPGRIMGHAGAFANLGEVTSQVKEQAFKDAGAAVVKHPTEFPAAISRLMTDLGKDPSSLTKVGAQKRGFHTMRRRPGVAEYQRTQREAAQQQKRGLKLQGTNATGLLTQAGVPVAEATGGADKRYLAISVDRSNRNPVFIASPTTDPNAVFSRAKYIGYDYTSGPSDTVIGEVATALQLSSGPAASMAALGKIVRGMAEVFKGKEAWALSTHLGNTSDGGLAVEQAEAGIDDSAYKSKRQLDVFEMREKDKEDPDEVEAEKDGIVYVKMEDPQAKVGTLINGAGLAMNALDALTHLGARPTNFLDTGGKATSETIKKSFALILNDSRVKVIFVNIFGGITLCDMIAEGIMLAFKDLQMKVPVVVRLRGTNEEKGQEMISKSGLPLHAYDDFAEAAKKCIELANSS